MSDSQQIYVRLNRHQRLAAANRSVIDTSIRSTKHNAIAAILRNGLAVVSYAAFEDFIKARTSELLSSLRIKNIPFDKLPANLQSAVTVRAFEAAKYQSVIASKRGDDAPNFLAKAAAEIGRSYNTTEGFSRFHVGHSKANLSTEDVKEMLRIFQVVDPWGSIRRLSSRLGSAVQDPKSLIHQAARRRHAAAHDPKAVCTSTELEDFLTQSLTVATCFDILCSRGAAGLCGKEPACLTDRSNITDKDIAIRFIDRSSVAWDERKENASRSTKSHNNLDTAIRLSSGRRAAVPEAVVVRNRGYRLRRWIACSKLL